jgi:hypothetical protein
LSSADYGDITHQAIHAIKGEVEEVTLETAYSDSGWAGTRRRR